jgi:hypothetical protein
MCCGHVHRDQGVRSRVKGSEAGSASGLEKEPIEPIMGSVVGKGSLATSVGMKLTCRIEVVLTME